jgi:hypothetical protein
MSTTYQASAETMGHFYALTPYWSADLGKKGDAKKMSYNILVMGVMNFMQLV